MTMLTFGVWINYFLLQMLRRSGSDDFGAEPEALLGLANFVQAQASQS